MPKRTDNKKSQKVSVCVYVCLCICPFFVCSSVFVPPRWSLLLRQCSPLHPLPTCMCATWLNCTLDTLIADLSQSPKYIRRRIPTDSVVVWVGGTTAVCCCCWLTCSVRVVVIMTIIKGQQMIHSVIFTVIAVLAGRCSQFLTAVKQRTRVAFYHLEC